MSVRQPEFEIRPWIRLASFGYLLLSLLLYGSVFAGFVFDSRLAVWLALTAFVATLAVHLGVSIVEYRRIMRREWPKVTPLADDDE